MHNSCGRPEIRGEDQVQEEDQGPESDKGRSMSNQPDLETLTSQIFFKLSPVVGIIKTRHS